LTVREQVLSNDFTLQFQPYVQFNANRTPFNYGGKTMYARVTIVQVLPGKMDEAIGIFRDSVVPAANLQKGHKGHYLLTDRQNNKGISISLWETEADMTRANPAAITYNSSPSSRTSLPRRLCGKPTRSVFSHKAKRIHVSSHRQV
jgi:hypothetical protein